MRLRRRVPRPTAGVLVSLEAAGHPAYLVGGCVRDILQGRPPLDWDIATGALPEQVMHLFERTVPTGLKYGTVTVIQSGVPIQVTTFRSETGYQDHRRPEGVTFIPDLQADLSRRDFTINAMALDARGCLYDPLGGRDDLRRRLVRAVGDPRRRFDEDGLRLLRGVRLVAELGFELEAETGRAMGEKAHLLDHIAPERIGAELARIVQSAHPGKGLVLLERTGLLDRFLPELRAGVGLIQNEHHVFTVWEHTVLAVEHVPPDLTLRLAALLHDVAKPYTLTVGDDGRRHFFGHELLGADMAEEILTRLRFGRPVVDRVRHLVRQHMALHHAPDMKEAAVRRLLARIGQDAIKPLLQLRQADRLASGTKQGPVSEGTARLLGRMERILAGDSALALRDLAVDGHDVQRVTGLPPGPAVGRILRRLLDAVLEEPALNRRQCLEDLARRLAADEDGRV
ncbi:MAG: HD domain-containing protein [bacterium]|nr:HD domain-containing protein [bacterium]